MVPCPRRTAPLPDIDRMIASTDEPLAKNDISASPDPVNRSMPNASRNTPCTEIPEANILPPTDRPPRLFITNSPDTVPSYACTSRNSNTARERSFLIKARVEPNLNDPKSTLLAVTAILPLKLANPDASITVFDQPELFAAAPLLPLSEASSAVKPVKSNAPALSCAFTCGTPFSEISAAPDSVLPPNSTTNSRNDRRRSEVSVTSAFISTVRPKPRGKSAPPRPKPRKN